MPAGGALWRHRPRYPADHPVSDGSEPGSVAAGHHGLDGDADAAQPAHAADPQCPRLFHRPAGPAAGDADTDRADECLSQCEQA